MRRERIAKGKWAEAGMSYEKGKSLKREMAKISQHITSTAASSTAVLAQHVTQAIEPLRAVLLPRAGESTAEAKARNRLEMQAILALEAKQKEEAKQEERAAKMQKQGSSSRMAS